MKSFLTSDTWWAGGSGSVVHNGETAEGWKVFMSWLKDRWQSWYFLPSFCLEYGYGWKGHSRTCKHRAISPGLTAPKWQRWQRKRRGWVWVPGGPLHHTWECFVFNIFQLNCTYSHIIWKSYRTCFLFSNGLASYFSPYLIALACTSIKTEGSRVAAPSPTRGWNQWGCPEGKLEEYAGPRGKAKGRLQRALSELGEHYGVVGRAGGD